ncbi:MAG: hypothetical protein IJS15_03855 [Victivallales bacterium]|nr:hypothetical protein [Victivallales bacterium]
MKRVFEILLLSLLALQAEPVIKSLTEWGGFTNGTGWDGTSSFCGAPLLCNDGTAYFIAPMRASDGLPETAASPLAGLYVGNPFSSSDCSLSLSGYEEMFYTITGFVNETGRRRVAGDAARNVVVCTTRERPAFGINSVTIAKSGSSSSGVAVGDEVFPANCTISVSGDGTLMAVGDLTSSYCFFDSSFNNVGITLAGDGRAVGISTDGSEVFFASEEALGGNEAGTLWIYSYNRVDGTIRPFIQVQDPSRAIMQDGAEIAYASSCEAFAFATNRSDLLDDSGNSYVDIYGRQVMLAKRDVEGEWSFVWCDGGSHLWNCGSPAVSADGRYVAFTASVRDGAPSQVFRFDSVTRTVNQVSLQSSVFDARTCAAPAISPNGRYVGFVTKPVESGDGKGTWRPGDVSVSDMGPVLEMEAENYVYGPLPAPFPINVVAGDGATLTISWQGSLPCEIYRLVGGKKVKVTNGAAFPANVGQLYILRKKDGSATIDFTLNDGDFELRSDCSIVCQERSYPSLHHLSYVMDGTEKVLANAGGYSMSGGHFAISGDGKTVAFTTLAKSRNESYSSTAIVVRTLAGFSRTVEDSGIVGRMALAWNGGQLFYLTAEGVLRYDVSAGESVVAVEGAEDFAVSKDGSAIAYVKGGLPFVGEECLSEEPGFSSPQVSGDGKVASFMKGDALYLWKGGALRILADGVSQALLSMSGASVLVIKDDVLKWLGAKEGAVELPCAASDAKALTLSDNGRFLAYCRTDGLQQAFRYDLFSGEEESMSVEPDGTYADAHVNPSLAISSDGARMLFATSATNVVQGKSPGLSNELYMAEVKTDVNAAAELVDEALSYDENDSAVVLPIAYSDNEGNDAVPELVSVPSELELELMAPDWEHPWYSLRCLSRDAQCCGQFKFRLRVWDGVAWSSAKEIALNVINVNDQPFWKDNAPAEFAVAEGAETIVADYRDYADDFDLANPAPYDNETLSFELKNAPAWVSLDGSALRLNPDYDVTTRGTELLADFRVVVRDRAGETAELPVSVTVSNTNRSPELGCESIEVHEGEEVPWEKFAASDPDAGDSLRIRLTSTGGKWRDRNGTVVKGDIAEDRFPIRFASDGKHYNELSASYVAVDDEAAVSAETATIRILLKKVRCKASEVWPELFSSNVSGWQLLSTPIAIDASELSALFGAELFVYDGKTFRSAEGVLKAGRGFLVYLQATPSDILLYGDRSEAHAISAGWNLVGPTLDGMAQEEQSFTIRNGVNVRNNDGLAIGRGYWIFVRNK